MTADFFSISDDKKQVKINPKKPPEIKNKKLQTLFQGLCNTPTSEYGDKHGNIKDLKSLFQALDQIAGDDNILSDEEIGKFLDGWILTQDMSVAEFKEMLLNYDVEVQETPQDTTHEQNLELKFEIETKPLGAHTEYKTEGNIQIEAYYDDNNQKTGEKRFNTATNETEVIEYFVNESGVDVTRSQKYDANGDLMETIEEEDSGVYKQRKTTYHQNGATKIETFDGNGNIEEATYTNKEQKSFNVQYMTDTEGNVYTQIVLQPGENITTVFGCTLNDLARWNGLSVDALNLHLDVPGTQLWIKGKLDPAAPKMHGRMTASEIQASRAQSLSSDFDNKTHLYSGNFYFLDGVKSLDEAVERIVLCETEYRDDEEYRMYELNVVRDACDVICQESQFATININMSMNLTSLQIKLRNIIIMEANEARNQVLNSRYGEQLYSANASTPTKEGDAQKAYNNTLKTFKDKLTCDCSVIQKFKPEIAQQYLREHKPSEEYLACRKIQLINTLRPQVAEFLGIEDPRLVTEEQILDFINGDQAFSMYLTVGGINWSMENDIKENTRITINNTQSENEEEIASAADDVLKQASQYTQYFRYLETREDLRDQYVGLQSLHEAANELANESGESEKSWYDYVSKDEAIAVSLRNLKNEKGTSFAAEVALYVINNAYTLRNADCDLYTCKIFARAIGISEIVIREYESKDDIKDLLKTYTYEAIYEDPDFVKIWIKSADSLEEKKAIAVQAGLPRNKVNDCKNEEEILALLDGYGYATAEESVTSIKDNWDAMSDANKEQMRTMREEYCGLTKEIDKVVCHFFGGDSYYELSDEVYANNRELHSLNNTIESMRSISAQMEAQFEILENNYITKADINKLNELKTQYDNLFEEFKTSFGNLSGVEYDHKTFCHLTQQIEVYQQAVALNKQMEEFTEISGTCRTSDDFDDCLDLVLKQLGNQLPKEELIKAIIQLAQIDEATFNNLSDRQKCDMLAKFCDLQNAQLQAYYQDVTGGKTVTTLENEIKETTDLLDGDRQEDLYNRVIGKAKKMARTSMIISIAVQILVTVVMAVISCGVGAVLMNTLSGIRWLSKCPALMSAIQMLFSGAASAGGSTLSQLILNDGSVDEGQVLEAFGFGCLGGAESKILSSLGMRDSGLIREGVESLWGACDSYAYNAWINPPDEGYGSREFFQEFVSDFLSSQLGGKVARGLDNRSAKANVYDANGKQIGTDNKTSLTYDGKDAQRIVTKDLNGNILGVRYVIPEDNKTTIKYFGPDGKTEVGKQETIFDKTNPNRTETRIFDENGNLQKIQIFNTDDANNTITVVTKDASGRKTSEAVYTKGTDGQIGEPQKYTSYQLREDGKIVKITRDINKPTGEIEQEVQSALTITKDTQDLASYDGEFVKTEDGVYGYLETYDIEVDGEAPQKSFIIKPIGNSSIEIMGQQISCADMELPYNPKTGKVEPTLEFIKANFETIKNNVKNKINETQSAGNGLNAALESIYNKAVAPVDTEGVTPSDADYQKAFNELQNINSLVESIIKNPEGANYEYFNTKQNFPGGKSAEFAITTTSGSGNITTYFNDAGEIVAIGQPKSKVDATEPPVIVMSNEGGSQTQYFRMDGEYIPQDIARRVLNNFTKQANTEVPSRENFASMCQASLDENKITKADEVSMQTYINTLSYNDVIALRDHLTHYAQSSKKAFDQINKMLSNRLRDLQLEHTIL